MKEIRRFVEQCLMVRGKLFDVTVTLPCGKKQVIL